MNIFLIIVWTIAVATFSLLGAWYARKYERPDAIIGLYVAIVLISNIVAYKISEYDVGIKIYATAASIIFPVTFLLTDIVNEKFGRKETHKMIFIAFIAQVAAAVFLYLSITLPSAPFWNGQQEFSKILGFTPRIMVASWIAFLVSENLDAYIFAWFKKITGEKHLWMRNVFSTIPSMVIDTILFVSIAFYGLQELGPLIWGVLLIKWISGIVDIPFMYLCKYIMTTKKPLKSE